MFDVVLLFQFTLLANDKLKMTCLVKHYSMENRGYTRSFDRVWAQNSILTLVNLEFCAHTRSFFWIKLGHKIPDSLMVGWNFVPIHDLLDLFIRS